MICKDCRTPLHQEAEKAIGSGEWAMVWADAEGEWVCPKTGNEHVASNDDERWPCRRAPRPCANHPVRES